MEDFSEDSESSDRIWIKVTPDQARWFCGLDDVPVTGDVHRPAELTEWDTSGAQGGEERRMGPPRSIERPNKRRRGDWESETESPVELEDLVVIKETAVYLDHGETKTALIIEGKGPPPVKARRPQGTAKGGTGTGPDKLAHAEVPPGGHSGGHLQQTWMGGMVQKKVGPGRADPHIEGQRAGTEGSSGDTREGGIQKANRPGEETPGRS